MMVDQFTMAQAKRDFDSGYMESFQIVRENIGYDWNVLLKAGTNRGPLVDARTKTARCFKSLDGAIAALEQIGFKVEALMRG